MFYVGLCVHWYVCMNIKSHSEPRDKYEFVSWDVAERDIMGMEIVGANKNNIIVVWMCVGLG